MQPDATVRVYAFRVLGDQHESLVLAPYMAVREHIDQVGGMVLEGTWRDVTPDELDARGRFRRVATGWGELA